MRISRDRRAVPPVVAVIIGAAVAIALLMMLEANPAGAKNSTYPERDYSNTINAEDSANQVEADEVSTAAITPTNNASSIAGAIARNASFVTGASFDAVPPLGQPNGTSDTALAGFPTHGSTYGLLTTGDANLAASPNNSQSSGANLGGDNVRGETDYDVSVLKVDLSVPSGANCLAVDFRFLSEEFPEYVGSSFNDAFIAELDKSTWTTTGSEISAPNNFAFDQNGKEISVNSTGAASVSAANAFGTTYDAATQLLQARTPITPGAHALYLSIFDQGDHIYDSAVFLDNLDVYSAPSGTCQKGATTGPTIIDTNPKAGATGVPRDTNVTATFSEQMTPNTITDSTFQLYQERLIKKKKGKGKGKKKKVLQRVPVSAKISCDDPCQTATLDPSSSLVANGNFRAVVTTGVKDSEGNPMEHSATWTFRTGTT